MRETIVIVGNGMVGHKFIELLLQRATDEQYHLVTFCEEPRTAYDRIHLSDYFSGKTADELMLATPDGYRQNGVQVFVGDRVAAIDRQAQKITSSKGVVIHYDKLVLANLLRALAGTATLASDLEFRICQVSASAHEVLGLRTEELAGSDLRETLRAIGWKDAAAACNREAVAQGPRNFQATIALGQVEFHVAPLLDEQQNSRGYLVLARRI